MDELPCKEYDLIFFRNAFIYFSPQSRERVLSNLAAALKKDGLLITGVSETAAVQHDGLDGKNRDDVYYFQKSARSPGNRLPESGIGYKMGFTV
jgi:chemotaxis methyl-accepting protein methylase